MWSYYFVLLIELSLIKFCVWGEILLFNRTFFKGQFFLPDTEFILGQLDGGTLFLDLTNCFVAYFSLLTVLSMQSKTFAWLIFESSSTNLFSKMSLKKMITYFLFISPVIDATFFGSLFFLPGVLFGLGTKVHDEFGLQSFCCKK